MVRQARVLPQPTQAARQPARRQARLHRSICVSVACGYYSALWRHALQVAAPLALCYNRRTCLRPNQIVGDVQEQGTIMDSNNNGWSFVLGLLCGVIAGAAGAALFVPRSGIETREQVTDRGIELKLRAEDTVKKAQDVANETVAKVQLAAQDLLQRGPTVSDATS